MLTASMKSFQDSIGKPITSHVYGIGSGREYFSDGSGRLIEMTQNTHQLTDIIEEIKSKEYPIISVVFGSNTKFTAAKLLEDVNCLISELESEREKSKRYEEALKILSEIEYQPLQPLQGFISTVRGLAREALASGGGE